MKRLIPRPLCLSLMVVLFFFSVNTRADELQSFLDPEDAFIPTVTIEGEQVAVTWHIEPGYFLYRHGFETKASSHLNNFSVLETVVPDGEKKFDEFFGREVETYHNTVSLTSSLGTFAGSPMQLVFTSQGCADEGLCFPPTSYHFTVDEQGTVKATTDADALYNDTALPPQPKKLAATPQSSHASQNIGLILLGALLGGVILNLMPCVFPVLSLKALSFAGGHDSTELLRKHGWSYTLGVVLSFLIAAAFILVARSAGQSLGWGFQLQHPIFVTFMVYLFFVMGLSLSGAFEFGGAFMGIGQQLTAGNTIKSSFFTGVLAALVASPCTAPFMATALGVALTQPVPTSLLIFATLGFGMALPFLALSYSPTLANWLPKPGTWMETFKQALAFPMYLTVIWLLWVLSHQASNERVTLTLIGLLLIVLALWISGLSSKNRHMKLVKNILSLTLVFLAILIATQNNIQENASDYVAEKYSAARLDDYRAQGKPVFVELTADWCLTCKVNEKIALTPTIKHQLTSQGIAMLVGDWTNKDSEITALLAQYERSGIPLYLMYPAGSGKPEILPQLLTVGIMEDAMARAKSKR